MIQCSSTLTNIFGVVLAVALIVYTYFKWTYSYWSRRNLVHLPPTIPIGNSQNPFHRTRPFYADIAEAYRILTAAGHKHAGFYIIATPVYFVFDPEYIKSIMTQDFQHFANHGRYYNEKADPLSAHLLALKDEKWKNLRAKLTPTFTSGKIKAMFQTILDCTLPMIEEISTFSAKNNALDIKELVAKFSTDVIGSCAFGVECNSFSNPDAEFRKYGKKAFKPGALNQIKVFLMLMMPKIAFTLNMAITEKNVSKFFLHMVRTTVEYRESGNHTRRDLMQLLIELKNQEDGISLEDVSAQAYIFFLAGFETSSTTMTFALYELAKHQNIQNKVRDEIEEVLKKYDGAITYDSLSEMKYLGQVIDETLRKYPPAPFLTRTCTKTYHVPDTDVVIEEGTRVIIPLYGIHHDPKYFSDPEEFIPDRFSDENKNKIAPFTYMPFGEGPRVCIGTRFGKIQVRSGLVAILARFRLRLNPNTPEILAMDPNSLLLNNKDTVYLDAEEIMTKT